MSGYADLSTTGLALGQVVSGNRVKRTLIEAAGDSLLKISGTSSSTACRLQGLAAPQGDDEATNKAYVQNFVMSQIRGLQLKQSVALCSTSNISIIAGAASDALTTLRWPNLSNATSDLATITASNSKTLNVNAYLRTASSKFAYGMVYNYPADSNQHILVTRVSFISSNLMGPLSTYGYIRTSGSAPVYLANGAVQIEFDQLKFLQAEFPPGVDIYHLRTYDRATNTSTIAVAKMVNGAFVYPTPLGGVSNPYSYTPNDPVTDGPTPSIQRLWIQPERLTVKSTVVSDSLLTLEAMFGPPPPSWAASPGIDGVVPTAGTRLLLTGQTDGKENGIWQVNSGVTALERPSDYAVGSAAGGCFVFVNGTGTSNDDKGFYCTTTPGQDIVDTNATAWTPYTTGGGKLGTLTVGTDTITASSGTLSLVNNALTTTGSITGSQLKSGSLTLSQGSLVDSSGAISLGSTNVSTSGTVRTGTLTMAAGSLSDSSGTLSLSSTSVVTTGTMTGANFYTASDARLKEVLSPLKVSLADMAKLVPVNFRWHSTGLEDTGLLAQDVQQVAPECVTVKDDGMLAVDYSRLVPYLLKWLQLLTAAVYK